MSTTNRASAATNTVSRARRATKLLFGMAALLSFFVSVGLWFSGSKEAGLYVGLWVPSILAAGTLLLVAEAR